MILWIFIIFEIIGMLWVYVKGILLILNYFEWFLSDFWSVIVGKDKDEDKREGEMILCKRRRKNLLGFIKKCVKKLSLNVK